MSVQSDIQDIITNADLMESFASKKILITGATGLIGSMLIKTLYSANENHGLDIGIVGLARSKERAREVLGDVVDHVSLVYSNGFNVETECDCLFHTASPTTSKYFIEHPVETIDTMLTGTKAMLKLARKKNAIFIYFSSMEEYGVPYIPGEVMTEDKVGIIDHLNVRSSYSEGKRMCECMCASYTSEYGVDARIVRLAQTFGAGVPLSDNRVPMQFAKSVINGDDIVLHTEGKSVSNFCYLSDAITGILAVAAKGERGEAYNVCNDKETRTIYEIATLIARRIANGEIEVVTDIPDNTNLGYAPDNTMKLCSDKLLKLGWIPKVTVEEGYRRLIEYLKEDIAQEEVRRQI